MIKLKAVAFLLSICSTSLLAQHTLHQSLYWTRYQNQLFFSDRLSWYNEVDNRRFFHPGMQNQLIAHTHLHYTIKNFEPAAGCSFSWIYAQDPEVGYKLAIPEIRPFQEVTYSLPLSKKFKLQERLRIDERFIRHHSSTELTPGYAFNFRFRFRTQLNYKLSTACILKLFDELMLNDRNNTFDQNRIQLAAEFIVCKNLSIEPAFMHIDQKRSSNAGYYEREVLRLSILHRLYLHKSKV